MEWCADHGVPHSAFLAWDEDDRSKLLAYILESRGRCSSCGTSQWEWDEDADAYTAMRHICKGCMILYAAEEDNDRSLGSRMVLVPKRRAQEIEAKPKRIRRRT